MNLAFSQVLFEFLHYGREFASYLDCHIQHIFHSCRDNLMFYLYIHNMEHSFQLPPRCNHSSNANKSIQNNLHKRTSNSNVKQPCWNRKENF